MDRKRSVCLVSCCPTWGRSSSSILFPGLLASGSLCLSALTFQNGIRNVLYSRNWFALCDECAYLSKRSGWRSISYRRSESWFSRGGRLRFRGSMGLRLEPGLIGLKVHGSLELPGTIYKSEFEGGRRENVSPCVIVTTSSNSQMCRLLGSLCRPQDRGQSSLKVIVVIPLIIVQLLEYSGTITRRLYFCHGVLFCPCERGTG
jgi:hypothetical protein